MQPTPWRQRALSSVLRLGTSALAGLARVPGWFAPAPARDALMERFDPFSQAHSTSPYAFYKALRDEAPLYRIPGTDFLCVSRYADVRQAARDTEAFSSNLVAILMRQGRAARSVRLPPLGPPDVLALCDAPRHLPQRRLAQAGLQAWLRRGGEARIRALVRELLAAVSGARPLRWMRDFAFVLPMRVALELVGFDPDEHRRVKAWCDHAVALLDIGNDAASLAEHFAAGLELYGWVQRNFTALRAKFSAGSPANLGQALCLALRQGSLREAEAHAIVLQLLIAGNDSTASTLGSAAKLLVERPSLQRRLRAEPQLLPRFVEEVLRLESPFQGHFRRATRTTELAGRRVARGTRLMLMWASANRDEREFDAPEELILERRNRHLAFGYGVHKCLGAGLARLELRIALEELLASTRWLGPLAGPAPYLRHWFVRTLRRLPLELS